ncbi:MAG TPA: class I SAM-dependent methyltransferase [Polyangiaceae bacterium]|nr:class I SAM-dependent methyltransferase [Polyangiaceae bacterium]
MAKKAHYRPPLAALQHRLLATGVAFVAFGALTKLGREALPVTLAAFAVAIGAHLGVLGLVLLGSCAWFRWLTAVLRPRDVERLLDALELRGDEVIVDLGTGDGIVAVAAAKRVPRGSVIAVDDWRRPHGGHGHSPAVVEANAELEGVAGRVRVMTAPFDRLDLPNASVDAAIACFSLHHLERSARAGALHELARVLAPNGRLLVAEPLHRTEFATTLEQARFTVTRGGRTFPRALFGWVLARR